MTVMTVKVLRNILSDYQDEDTILFRGENTDDPDRQISLEFLDAYVLEDRTQMIFLLTSPEIDTPETTPVKD